MSMKSGQIRCLALLVARHNNRLLVSPGYDQIKQNNFYRLLGGEIEVGEDSLAALRREIKEELGLELENCRLIKVLENIFEFNGQLGHEICFVYEANFVELEIYEQENRQILDVPGHQAVWIDLNSKNIWKIKPDGLEEYLSS